MDILYHSIVGYTVAKAIGSPDIIPASTVALLPDIIGMMPFYYFTILKASKKPSCGFFRSFWQSVNSNTFHNNIDRSTYLFFHSFVILPFIGLISYLLYPASWLLLTLVCVSHILIDIPTHDGVYATQIFYPFSSVHYEGKKWWKNRNVFLFFWSGLIVILFTFRAL